MLLSVLIIFRSQKNQRLKKEKHNLASAANNSFSALCKEQPLYSVKLEPKKIERVINTPKIKEKIPTKDPFTTFCRYSFCTAKVG
jgi:hypothetical protein